MSLISLFTRSSPNLVGITFDAILESTFTASVEFTELHN